MNTRNSPTAAAVKALNFVVENADEHGPAEQELDRMEEALKALTIDGARSFMVCVDGGCVTAEDEHILDPLRAVRRAEDLKAEDPESLVTVVFT